MLTDTHHCLLFTLRHKAASGLLCEPLICLSPSNHPSVPPRFSAQVVEHTEAVLSYEALPLTTLVSSRPLSLSLSLTSI